MTDDILAGLVDEPSDLNSAHNATGDTEPEAENHFPDLESFVRWLAVVYARPVARGDRRFCWCYLWWEHAEAVARLEGLWRAFETLRQDPTTGAAVWWRDYADPTMNALSDPEGTFAQCSDNMHKVPKDLPLSPAPPGWL